MGLVASRLCIVHDHDAAVASALQTLRELQTTFSRRRDRIAANLQGPDREILELRAAIRARTLARARPEEQSALRLWLSKRRMYVARIERFDQLVLQLERQILAIEDADTAQHALGAMQQGARATQQLQQVLDKYHDVLARVEEQQDALQDLSSACTLDDISDADVLDELNQLMTDEAITIPPQPEPVADDRPLLHAMAM